MMIEHCVRGAKRAPREAGASLLEVLIAILIMSFGLLALGGLTAAAQQYVKMAQFQSLGMLLSSELGERMRANVRAFEAGSYNKTAAYSTATATVPPCSASPCTIAEVAAIDLAKWTNELRGQLPGGDAFVRRDAVNPLAADVWILWIDPDLQVGATEKLEVVGANDCPAAAVSGIAASAPKPRCMYYRISI